MNLDQNTKSQMIEAKLSQLAKRHFELELDVISLEANGDVEGAKTYRERMAIVEKSYKAIEGMVK